MGCFSLAWIECDCGIFRTIYLGETFASYISVHNDSEEMAADVVVKVCSVMTTTSLFLLFVETKMVVVV